jgi:hypothetical protein
VSVNKVSSFSFFKEQTITQTAYLYMTEICLTPQFEEHSDITFCSQQDGALPKFFPCGRHNSSTAVSQLDNLEDNIRK